MWEIGLNKGFERRWPTPNRLDKGEGVDDVVFEMCTLFCDSFT